MEIKSTGRVFICVIFLCIFVKSHAFIANTTEQHEIGVKVAKHDSISMNNESILDEKNANRMKRSVKKLDGNCAAASNVGIGVGGGAAIGAAGGAGAGALVGSVVPGIGTAIGALIGGVIGGFGGAGGGAGVTHFAVTPSICGREIGEFLLQKDFGIIEDDDKTTLLNEAKKANPGLVISDLEIHDKNRVSAQIKATSESPYKTGSSVKVNYLVARNLHDTSLLLKDWSENYRKFLDELQRQITHDIKHFSAAHNRTWFGDKQIQMDFLIMQLKQNIEIVRLDEYIKKLYDRVDALENDLAKLKEIINELQHSVNCAGMSRKLDSIKSGADTFEKISDKFSIIVEFVPKSATVVPVVGNIFAGVSVLYSVACFLQSLN